MTSTLVTTVETHALQVVPRKAGRPRKYQDLEAGEKGTRAQRKAIQTRELSRAKREQDVVAFNRHKMELYYARKAKREAEKQGFEKMKAFVDGIKAIMV